ncbi:rhomboid domain-containing protein 3 isoform 1-T5 [Discoglossus pictus]
MLGRVLDAVVPPLGCCLLMLLLICMGLMGECSQMELHLESIRDAWDGHRFFTHVLCAPDGRLLLLSLVLFPLLCCQLEKHMGTICYLYMSCLCTLCSAALYIVLSWLLPLTSGPAFGYLATQLALLISQSTAIRHQLGKRLAPLLPCGILIIAQLLCPLSPLLLHICGVIIGLIFCFGVLSGLELSDHHTRTIERTKLYSCLASIPFVRLISSRSRGALLPEINPSSGDRPPFSYAEVSQFPLLTDTPWVGVSTQAYPFAGISETSSSPLFGVAEELEEELLRAGIQASLREYKEQEIERQELTLHKSSVSALRLQQLERMGFPTGPSVVALAATGKVERAVSLLVEGQVGEDILVASERQSQ